MNCNVIQDLLILYEDGCCSEESKALVEEHIKGCAECNQAYNEMQLDIITEVKSNDNQNSFKRINAWKASVMQSVLLFLSFALLTFGVAREAATPTENSNALWAMAIIIPTAGFLLSLANWYFVRIYSSRKTFSNCSILITIVFIIFGYVWGMLHYQGELANLFNGSAMSVRMLIIGCVLNIILCVISKLLSDKYAEMLGKE